MKKVILWILLFVVNLAAETVIFPRLIPLGFRPDMVIVVITVASMIGDWIVAGIYGAAHGIVVGVILGRYVGLEALVYLAVAVVAGIFSKRHFSNNVVFAAIAAFAAIWIKEVLTVLLISLFGSVTAIDSVLLMILTSALVTAVVTVPIYLVSNRSMMLNTRRKRYQ